jgi:hypothetical protein
MIFLKSSQINLEKHIIIVLTVVSLLFFSKEAIAQEPPPRPIEVTPTSQELSFGAFTYAVTTGTVTVTPAGGRSASGLGVVLLNMGIPTAALFNIVANAGTLITITNGPDATLTGPPGGTLTLKIGTTNPASPFVTTNDYPNPTLLYIGGTLTVGNSVTSPPGTYSGTFDLTFSQD